MKELGFNSKQSTSGVHLLKYPLIHYIFIEEILYSKHYKVFSSPIEVEADGQFCTGMDYPGPFSAGEEFTKQCYVRAEGKHISFQLLPHFQANKALGY